MSNADEILNVSKELGINCTLLTEEKGLNFTSIVLEKFKPLKTTGHLAIDQNSISIPLEENEFSYSARLDGEQACIFFDQEGDDRKKVLLLESAQDLCKIMENSFGMEYFLSNVNGDYLIAVNWYVIEVAGSVKKVFADLT